MAKILKLAITNNGEDVKQMEQSSYNAGSYNNNSTTLENSFAVTKKAKHIPTLWPSNFTPRYTPVRTESCVH